ncbi:MAG: hypothetical protein WD055_00680 [Candidatus Dependentiae bacterium]
MKKKTIPLSLLCVLFYSNALLCADPLAIQVLDSDAERQLMMIDVRKEIASGAQIHQALSSGKDSQIVQFQDNYPESIRSFVWWVYAKGQKKFSEGTFVVQDTPTFSILTFLKSCPGVYERCSTHFKYNVEKEPQFGFDIADLPTQTTKRTILFGKAGKDIKKQADLIFIKPESWGTATWGHWIMHSLQLPLCVARKVPYLQYLAGTDDDPGYQKERIPNDVWYEFIDLIAQIQSVVAEEHKVKGEDFIANAYQRGIAYMISVLDDLVVLDQEVALKVSLFIKKLNERFDHTDKRYGNEVVIVLDEVQEICPEVIEKLAQEHLQRYPVKICA